MSNIHYVRLDRQPKLVHFKHGHILLFARRIYEKHTRILKYDVFMENVFDVFFVLVFKRNYDKIRLKNVSNTPKYAYIDVLWNN